MRSLLDYDRDCFFCRILRSFAITGLGAGVSGFAALHLGAPREEAAYWALAGGALLMVFITNRRLSRERRRRRP